MSHSTHSPLLRPWKRRQVVMAGLSGLGLLGGAIAVSQLTRKPSVQIPPLPSTPTTADDSLSPLKFLRTFDYGQVTRQQGRPIREFYLEAHTEPIQLNRATTFVSWNYNHQVPGPTLRATQGDRVRVMFSNDGGHSHSAHFHGIHPAAADGVRPVRHGTRTIYEFDAEPYGVHLYHCHVEPITRHVGKGMYGLFIVDPPGGRPPADEMVLIMAGYDLNDDRHNELYAFNGLPDYYHHHPIPIQQDQLIRLYVLNMIEFDPAVTFHLHANFFQVYRTGMTLTPTETADVLTMGTAERHLLEFTFRYPGRYMFHPHQDAIAERGCMGEFEVIPSPA